MCVPSFPVFLKFFFIGYGPSRIPPPRPAGTGGTNSRGPYKIVCGNPQLNPLLGQPPLLVLPLELKLREQSAVVHRWSSGDVRPYFGLGTAVLWISAHSGHHGR